MSVQTFAELGVSRAVVSALASQGISQPFPVQQAVIGDVLAGRDVLVKSPTGSGKTLAFGIPVIERTAADGARPSALVLAPTRELATQIVEEIRTIAHARALRVTAVYGGVGIPKQERAGASSHIVVATPGRLEDLLARGAFSLDRVRTLVLDEADRMLDMGFHPAVKRIVAACPADRQTLFFSATLDGEAGRLAEAYTQNAARHEHGPRERRPSLDVEHRFVDVTHERRVQALVGELEAERELALVFVRTKRGADKLVKRLAENGVNAVAMHGDKSQRNREKALARFESGSIDTLVATDVAARGLDVDRISHVINYDPPGDNETYVHRVGRTGRAGRKGVGITLVAPDQRREIGQLATGLGIDSTLIDVRPMTGTPARVVLTPATTTTTSSASAEPSRPAGKAFRHKDRSGSGRSGRRPRKPGDRSNHASERSNHASERGSHAGERSSHQAERGGHDVKRGGAPGSDRPARGGDRNRQSSAERHPPRAGTPGRGPGRPGRRDARQTNRAA